MKLDELDKIDVRLFHGNDKTLLEYRAKETTETMMYSWLEGF